MARMTVLGSGSKGNSTLVASGRTKILVDAGLSCRELLRRMEAAGESAKEIDALLITHEHQDHVQGLAVLARRLGVPVYFTEATHRAWIRWMTPHKRTTYAEWLAQRRQDSARTQALKDAVDQPRSADPDLSNRTQSSIDSVDPIDPVVDAGSSLPQAAGRGKRGQGKVSDPCALPKVEHFIAGCKFSIGDIEVTPFTVPHDAADPVGFVFDLDGVRMAMATDLGYMPNNVKLALRNCDILLLESNHDLDMLRDGPYPWPVKQRVMSRVGHLSNAAAAEFLEKNYDGSATYIVLAHLSESNNLPELARIAAERGLRDRASLMANHLKLAEQATPLEPICL